MEKRNIAIFLQLDVGWDRAVATGVAQFARTRPEWRLFVWLKPPEAFDAPPGWRCHGAIAHRVSPPFLQAATPLVHVGMKDEPGVAVDVSPDDYAIGQVAAKHLRELGFRSMTFYGGDRPWAFEREAGFRTTARELGAQYLPCPMRHPFHGDVDWTDEATELSQWLGSLHGPLGLMGAHDGYARVASQACELVGLAVPEHVAIVGVDNDLMRCELASPPLSSVDPSADRIGFAAAQLLEGWLTEGVAGSDSVRIPPRGVVPRRSTDVLAIEDEAVAMALRFVRERAFGPLTVDAVAEQACLSRSSLDKRFKRHVGRSVQQEITRWRVQQACEMLRGSDERLDHIGHACGFGSLAYFHSVFKRETGRSPGAYRRWVRGGGE